MSELLKDRVRRCLLEAQEALENKEKLTRLAFNSGGSDEVQYKAMRNKESDRREALLAEAESAMIELQEYDIETEVMQDGFTTRFHARK